jgi:DNA-binding SARP family transcriptional activator
MKEQAETLYDIKMTSFGGLQFASRGEPVPDSKWRKKKGKSVLANMMLNPGVQYNKDKLINIFYPDIKPETADENFRQAIFNIRSVFKNPYLNILLYESKMLQLNPDCYYKSDAMEFDQNYKTARSTEKDASMKIKACRNAINIYKGEFLEGFYELWCEDIRNEYSNKFISMYELMLNLLNAEGSYDEIIEYSENLLKYDSLNETAFTCMVEAFINLNKSKSARQTYKRMLNIYEKELGERPNNKTLDHMNSLLKVSSSS